MMSIDGAYPNGTRWSRWTIAPDAGREQLLNLLCELREDPRFAEWCRLTSALGLGSLPLEQVVALHAGATEAIFPEVGDWGRAFGEALAMPSVGDGASDTVVTGEAGSVRWVSGYTDGPIPPHTGVSLPPPARGDHAIGTHPAQVPHHTERIG